MPELGLGEDTHAENGNADDGVVLGDSPPSSPQVHFEPVVQLPLVEVSTNEEEEVEMIKLRAKLYRYDTSDSPAEWKERGTGDVKLLRHKIKNTVRVVMRRDKTLKLCANHFVWPWMELNPNCSSDRAWVWSALADFADEQPKPQLLAIRFANAENAQLWKEAFDKARKIVETECEAYSGKPDSDDEIDSDDDSESDDDKNKEATADDKHSKEQSKKPTDESSEIAQTDLRHKEKVSSTKIVDIVDLTCKAKDDVSKLKVQSTNQDSQSKESTEVKKITDDDTPDISKLNLKVKEEE